MSCQICEFELIRRTCLSLRDAVLKHKLLTLELVHRTSCAPLVATWYGYLALSPPLNLFYIPETQQTT